MSVIAKAIQDLGLSLTSDIGGACKDQIQERVVHSMLGNYIGYTIREMTVDDAFAKQLVRLHRGEIPEITSEGWKPSGIQVPVAVIDIIGDKGVLTCQLPTFCAITIRQLWK